MKPQLDRIYLSFGTTTLLKRSLQFRVYLGFRKMNIMNLARNIRHEFHMVANFV